jgi:hypothetical protein
LKKNLYGQKQAGQVWNQYLHDGLIARGLIQSKVDMCVYYYGKVVLLAYVDNGIFIGPTQEEIQHCYNMLTKDFVDKTQTPCKKYRKFRMTDEGDLSDYLGVKITRLKNGLIKLLQPHLVDQILMDLGYNDRTASVGTPAASSIKLGRDINGSHLTKLGIIAA